MSAIKDYIAFVYKHHTQIHKADFEVCGKDECKEARAIELEFEALRAVAEAAEIFRNEAFSGGFDIAPSNSRAGRLRDALEAWKAAKK